MVQHSSTPLQEGNHLAVLVANSIHDGGAIIPGGRHTAHQQPLKRQAALPGIACSSRLQQQGAIPQAGTDIMFLCIRNFLRRAALAVWLMAGATQQPAQATEGGQAVLSQQHVQQAVLAGQPLQRGMAITIYSRKGWTGSDSFGPPAASSPALAQHMPLP